MSPQQPSLGAVRAAAASQVPLRGAEKTSRPSLTGLRGPGLCSAPGVLCDPREAPPLRAPGFDLD